MKKLTKREKLLIYTLGCFLIGFFGIYFVILPSFSSFQVVNDQVTEAQFTKESIEMAIDAIPSTMQTRDDATASLATLKAPFQPKLTNEGLDMLLTQLSLDYSLSPKVLAIESNELARVATFTAYTSDEQPSASVGTEDTTLDTTASTDATTDTTTESADATTDTTTESADAAISGEGPETWAGVVNMELTGTQTNFYRLLDAVAARPDMIVSTFAIAPEAAATTAGTTSTTNTTAQLNGGNISINVTFTVYMVEK
ncbi:hypothetical protein [Acetobacterium sp. K1/6]|uniref:hypothetical protein n=1 Tax=Acetobacterium sp. K1/6 TaxID=3055467 RepID=UPI002ACA1748|nr:hypothetical protein [Acetobacterium sp. K1/6]MDZ5724352.1 hypothetical protein [Acetobacterium sp. K1/6]